MKVDFNFGAMAEITLTPESPGEESLVKMCYEVDTYPIVSRSGTNVLKLVFCTGMKSCADIKYIPQNLSEEKPQ